MSYINRESRDIKHNVNNLVADVILYEKVIVGLPMAKRLTKLLAKLITWAKKDTLHSRRLALNYLVNRKKEGVLNKLFVDLKKRYTERNGGYSRIIKIGMRSGDSSLRVAFSLV